ncbi:MAG TPA: amino acid adenylation domain-containing protein, partial [Candidatus Deferrimicrobium sp.]|nr:amino acid adenylation domain-containing protein [Candidatus Deferrimicrobium sp.]
MVLNFEHLNFKFVSNFGFRISNFNSSNPAYIIYTSGSTGKPKGVMVEHGSAVNILLYRKATYKINNQVTSLLLFSYSFDGFVTDCFTPLISGARVVLLGREGRKDPYVIKTAIAGNKVSHVFCTPPLFQAVIEALTVNEAASLRVVTLGGDRLPASLLAAVRQKNAAIEVVHEYGVTEAAVTSTLYRHQEQDQQIKIGRPVWNTMIHIQDVQGDLQPIGTAGEMFIGGAGVARGYLNNPELTEEKFINKSFSGGQGGRFFKKAPLVYKTGDLARWLSDGNIEFLGRIDYQVKIRGFRIELGEIEGRLQKIPGIQRAAVLAKPDHKGNNFLCAYIVNEGNITDDSLKERLARDLPDYMIPAYFIRLAQIPLTSTGKIDTKNLPEVTISIDRSHVAPRNEVEKRLAEVWQDVLGMEQVGIKDDFFQVGGDSIKAMQMVSRLKKYGLSVKINDLFARSTIEKLAACTYTVTRQISQEVVQGEVPLTPIQHWFFANNFTSGHHFNQAVMLYRADGFDEGILQKVFTKLVEHHDALRMVYELKDAQVIQQNRGIKGKLFDLEVFNSTVEIQQQATRIQGSMDLANGPLVKLGLFKTEQGDHLLVAIHHLVVDGVSWRILIEDIHTGYAQAEAGQPIKFPEKTDSFQYWSQKLTQYAQSLPPIKNLTVTHPIPLLPRDRKIDRGQKKLKYVEAVALELTRYDTQNLLKSVNRAYNTEINDILLTALGLAVQEWSGTREVLINLEGHGREGIIEGMDISRTVGWFTSQFPVLLDMEGGDDISYAIKNVKETLRRIPHKGIDFGIAQYLANLAPVEKTGNSLFQLEPEIGFNYLGQFDSPGESPENANNQLIQFSSLSSGESMSGEFEQLHPLGITGIITAGKLSLTFAYNRHEFDKTTICSLADCFERKLSAIIGHCIQKQEPGLTPSDVMDVSHSALSLEEFSGIHGHIAATIPGKPAIESIYPLSPMQKGILFHWLTRSEYDIYFIQNLFRLEGHLDQSILAASINQLIARYDIFRTIFMHQGLAEPLQVVLNRRSVQVHYHDMAHLQDEAQEQVLNEWFRKEKECGFDLSSDVMMRLTLFKTGANTFCLGWGFHHILMDGWCMGIIYNELLEIYGALAAGKVPRLNEATPYRHYIQWLMKQDKAAGLAYWQDYLAGYENQAGLPKVHASTGAYRLEECLLEIGPGVTSQLTAFAGNHAVTVSTVFQSVWGVALQKYNNSNDVVFGVIVSGRPPELPGVEQMVGLFINTIPVRIVGQGEQSFENLVCTLQQEGAMSKSYEYLPLAEIQSLTRLKSNLIDHILVFENYPLHRQVKNAALSQQSAVNNTGTGWQVHDIKIMEQTNYDFYITIIPGENITVKLSYNAAVYDKAFIERTAGHIDEIMRQAITYPGMPLKDIAVLTAEERENILAELNRVDVPYPDNKTIHELFETQVETKPDHIAVFGHGHASITYRELNERSGRLAGWLIEQGVLTDNIVGIMMERSIDMIAGILGILKSGGAYMPIDPEYPQERIQYMLQDSKARIFEHLNVDIVCTRGFGFRISNLIPSNLAYVIYTSGSTGKPKGTLIEHRHVVRLLFNDQFQFDFNNHDIWTLFHSFCFDFSVWEMYGALLYGGKLVIVPKATARDPWEFLSVLKKQCVTVLNQTPASFYNLINEELQTPARHLHLRYVIFGGEALNPAQLKPWQDMYPGCLLVNMYGITETTVHVTYKEIGRLESASEASNIGRPIPTLCVYLLDRDLNLVPRDVAGELCVGGEGVARGYLNRPELSAEKFYRAHKSYRTYILYRSGDMARLLENGDIEYLGRLDQQVKIRGFRIEPGEIENRLLKKPGIKNVAVLPRQDTQGNKYLCAYIVTRNNIDPAELREYLSQDLPDYMIPAYFISINKIPLTANGKIDRQALPLPEAGIMPGQDYVAPSREVEKRLAEIWQDVLGVQQVGVMDNFFALGGDSIKAILVASRLKKYGWELKINDLFTHPVIEQLARCVTRVTRQINQGTVLGEIPLTPIQHWFFQSYSTGREHFNQAVMLYRQKGIDKEILEQVFTGLISHHDALRMVYEFKGSSVIQRNRGLDGKLFDLEVMDLKHLTGKESEDEIDRVVRRIQAGIDLTNGPLVKLGLFKTAAGDHLLIAIHHLVIDGVSWRILLEDLQTGYKQAESGQSFQFPDKTDSFQHWSQKLANYAQNLPPITNLARWNSSLPRDREIGTDQKKLEYIESVTIELNEIDSERLLKKVSRAFNTEINDLLLTALGLAVKEWSGIDQVAVNLEGHGREGLIDGVDISRTVGWFTSLFPVILDMGRCDGLAYALKNVKETLRRIPAKGIMVGIAKYLAPRDDFEEVEPEIMFNYLGQFSNPGESNEKDGALFEFSRLAAAGSASPGLAQVHTLTVNGMMTAGKLSLSFLYNRLEYDEKTIRCLTGCYQTYLVDLIDFCCRYPQRELTPSDVMDVIDYTVSLAEFSGITKHIEANIVEKPTIEAIYPLNPMQKGMFYHWLTRTDYDMYFIQSVFKIEGSMDKELLETSFNKLIERYDIFRTIFIHQGLVEPLQVVLDRRRVPVAYHDITQMPAAGQEQMIEQWSQSRKKQGFDLNTDVMMRLALFKIGDRQFQLGWEFHHILMDGWCLAIIYNELIEIYRSLAAGEPVRLTGVTPYKHYIRWWVKQDKNAGLTYWESYLDGYETQAGLPRISSIKGSAGSHYHLAEHEFEICAQDNAALSALAGSSRVTVNILFQALWGLLLQKYNNTHDVVFGAVVSGRPAELAGVERMVGLFINTVPVRVDSKPGQDFLNLVRDLQQNAAQGKSFEYVPLADIQAKSSLKGDLINHIMVFENYPVSRQVKNTPEAANFQLDWKVQEVKLLEQTSYDFNIIIVPGDDIDVRLSYNAIVYDESTIKRVEGHFREILSQVLANPMTPLAEISILTAAEKEQLLVAFNRTETAYPGDKCINQLFEAQVEKTPDHIAIFGRGHASTNRTNPDDNLVITYRQLNEQSDRLAGLLIEKGVLADSIIGIMMERSIEMIVGIMAILKAGGAYMPIDPDYPQERVDYMLKDSGTKFLINKSEIRNPKSETNSKETNPNDQNKNFEGLEVLDFEHLNFDIVPDFVLRAPDLIPSSLAYVIYTSGSTGKPKGILTTHYNVTRVVKETNYIQLHKNDRLLQLSNYAFDGSVFDIFGALLNGAALVIITRQDSLAIDVLSDVIVRQAITVFFTTTALFNVLVDFGLGCLNSVRKILFGGERISVEHTRKALAFLGKEGLIHVYGPTETTVYATFYDIDTIDERRETIPIGKPIANTTAYILDNFFQPVPLGIAGELFIGGAGVARGYLNNPELTIENFNRLYNPHKPYILYKTGDLVRWLDSGNIEFLGRVDHQVKIRGHRIEAGEIEYRLLQHPEVKEAVVTAPETSPGNRCICAYIVPVGKIDMVAVKNHLSQSLPEYMIPDYFVPLETFPLNPNGKVDMKKLPQPGVNINDTYIAPRTGGELKLAEIWSQVLGIKKDIIGIDTDFFELGGHSLKVTVLSSLIHKELNVKIPLEELFKTRTVRGQAEYIAQLGATTKDIFKAIEPAEQKEYYDLSSAQKRLYFLQQMEPESTAYNISLVVPLGENIEIAKLEETGKKLLARHESLRTSFEIVNNEPVQRIH